MEDCGIVHCYVRVIHLYIVLLVVADGNCRYAQNPIKISNQNQQSTDEQNARTQIVLVIVIHKILEQPGN